MRFIFVIFCLFMGLFCVPNHVDAETGTVLQSSDHPKELTRDESLKNMFVAWIHKIKSLHSDALNPKETDAPLESNGQFNPLRLLYMDELDMSPLTGKKGHGEWFSFSGGKARLISGYAGTRGNKLAFLNIQIVLDSPFWLKNPMTTDKTYPAPESFFAPLPAVYRIPDQNEILRQKKNIFLPLIYHLKNPDISFTFQVQTEFDLCQNDICHHQKLTLSLDMTPGDRIATSFNAKMIDELQQVARPIRLSADTQTPAESNLIQIKMNLPEDNPIFNVYPADDPTLFKTQKIESFDDDHVLITLSFPKNTFPKNLNLILKTSAGFYETQIPVNNTFTAFNRLPDLQIIDFMAMVLLLILISPFYAFLFMQNPRSNSQKQMLTRQVFKTALLYLCLFMILMMFGHPFPDHVLYTHSGFLFWIGLIICLILVSKLHSSLNYAIALFWLMPKSFAEDMALVHPIALWMAVFVSMLLFIIPFKKTDDFFKTLNKIPQKNKKKIILPIILFLTWNALGPLIGNTGQLPEYTDEIRKQALTENKALIVSVENETCTQCRLNKLIFLKTGLIRMIERQKKLTVSQTTTDDPKIKPFLKNGQIPQVLIFGPGLPKGKQIPSWTKHSDFKRFFQEAVLTNTVF